MLEQYERRVFLKLTVYLQKGSHVFMLNGLTSKFAGPHWKQAIKHDALLA